MYEVGVGNSLKNPQKFSLEINPKINTMEVRGAVSYDAEITFFNDFNSTDIELWAKGAPKGITVQYIPRKLSHQGVSVLMLQGDGTEKPGKYQLTVGGVANGITRTKKVGLIVSTNPNNETPPTIEETSLKKKSGKKEGSRYEVAVIGETDARNNTLRVGAARNDGIDRIYVGTVETGKIFEFSWVGSKWNRAYIGGSPIGEEIHNMTIGPGRNDGVLRLYAGSTDGNLHELSFTSSGWVQEAVGKKTDHVFHAVVGNGRNDGINRVYAVRGISVFEYTWNESRWEEILMGKVSKGAAHGIDLGEGRSDGRNYMYVASTGSGVYEGVFENGAWTFSKMGDTGDIRNVGVGEGRGDGVKRVYGALLPGQRIREFTWDGNKWAFKDATSPIGEKLVHAYILSGRRDGIHRLYSSGSHGNAYEFSWNGSSWDKYTLGGGSGYMYGFHFGDGRNDEVIRLYGGNFNARVYEYTFTP